MIYEGNGLCLTLKLGEAIEFVMNGETIKLTIDKVYKTKGQIRIKASDQIIIKRVKKDIEERE